MSSLTGTDIVCEISDIEQQCFADAWDYDSILGSLRYDYCRLVVACEKDGCIDVFSISGGCMFLNELNALCLGLTDVKKVVGYAIVNLIGDESELLRIAVAPTSRHKHIGKKVMEFYLQDVQAQSYFLEVRASNQEARGLYESSGYKRIAVRKNYYKHPDEDAVIYQLS